MSLSFTRRTDYALVALAALVPANALASAHQIAEAHHLPRGLLTNLLKALQQAGLVRSRRGSHGGYELGRPADQISVLDVVEAVEGPVRVALCCGEPAEQACTACQLATHCPVMDAIQALNGALLESLRRVSLRDLVEQRVPKREPLPPATILRLPRPVELSVSVGG